MMDATTSHGVRQPRNMLDAPPPADDAAELALVGGLLARPDWVGPALADLPPDALRQARCRLIWAAAQDLQRDGQEIDLHSIGCHLAERGEFRAVGGMDGLLDLLWRGLPGYAAGMTQRVARASACRDVLAVGCEVLAAAHAGDPATVLAAGERLVELAAAMEGGTAQRRKLRIRRAG